MILSSCNTGMFITQMVIVIAVVTNYGGMLAFALTITSSVPIGGHVCPGQEITFTCVTQGSPTIAWASSEYIDRGSYIEFAVFNRPGDVGISPINPNTIATLVDNKIEDGAQILRSVLHIIASAKFSIFSISCFHGNGTGDTITLFLQNELNIPQDIAVNQRMEGCTVGGCVMYLGWTPPTSTAQDDVSHYMIYINGTNIFNKTTNIGQNLILTAYPVCFCAAHQVKVSAVDRCGHEGQRSPNITPLQDPFSFSFECEFVSITPSTNPVADPGSSAITIGLVVTIVILFLFVFVMIVSSIIILYYYYYCYCFYCRN